MMYRAGFQVKEVLQLMSLVQAVQPLVKQIWEFSVLSQARDEKVSQVLNTQKRLLEAVELGRLTMEAPVPGNFA